MNMEQQLGINTVIDIQHISYGVGCICVRAAHLLMNIEDVVARRRWREGDRRREKEREAGGHFRVTDDRIYDPRGVHSSGEHDCTFTHSLHSLMHDVARRNQTAKRMWQLDFFFFFLVYVCSSIPSPQKWWWCVCNSWYCWGGNVHGLNRMWRKTLHNLWWTVTTAFPHIVTWLFINMNWENTCILRSRLCFSPPFRWVSLVRLYCEAEGLSVSFHTLKV